MGNAHVHVWLHAVLFITSTIQALLQSGEVEESIPHFQQALRLLNANLPSRKPRVMMSIISQAFRQWLHVRFPRRFIGRQRWTYMYMCMYMCVYCMQCEGKNVHVHTMYIVATCTVYESKKRKHFYPTLPYPVHLHAFCF